ncbi:hypothetical protein CCO03_09440 [Comamonas serinivorans]|uniref:WGR domain-containing protein n=1 Tax=Comamonas serinivorans TaxID=1082851 RepID=A0A1Y0EN62_9BURK|nr:WGR and DUF4132 domain-containing protein [Comamonas serinivorans]ARU04871.1 hypothetical protein CCO03_09440 [Comamonas serinivorans]
MQRYELSDGSSNKFWQIERQGSELHISWGKIGTNGQSQVKAFDSAAKAEAARDKLIKEKTGKGYVATGDAPMAAGATPKAKAPAPSPARATTDAGATADATTAAAAAAASPAAKAAASRQHTPAKAASTSSAPAAPVPSDGAAPSAATPAPSSPMAAAAGPATSPLAAGQQAPREAIDAWLAQQRETPGLDEQGAEAWPRALQFLIDEAKGKSRVSLTPTKLQRAIGADDLVMHHIDALFAQSKVLRGYGLAGLSYVDGSSASKAAEVLAQAQASADSVRTQLHAVRAAVWAPLAATEPGAPWPARFGQRLGLSEASVKPWPLRGARVYAKPSERTAKEAWFLLRSGKLGFLSAAQSHADYRDAIDAFHRRLANEATAEPDLASDQILLNLCVHVTHEGSVRSNLSHIVAYLVQAHGLAQVIRMLAESAQVTADYNYSAGRRWGLQPRTGSYALTVLRAPTDNLLHLVRRWLLAADDAEWQAAVAAAIEVLPSLREDERGWLGPLFAESPEVAQAAMASFAGRSLPKSAQWLLVSLPPGDDARRLMALKPEVDEDSLYTHPELLSPLLDKLGDDALAFLANGVAYPAIANLLAQTNEPEAIQALARQASSGKDAQARLKLALARWPLAGAIGLARQCAQGGKDTPLLLPLLRQLMAQLGPALTLAQPWLSPAASQLVSDLLAKQQAVQSRFAPTDDLPPVLREVPWLRAKTRSATKAMALEPLALADVQAQDASASPLPNWAQHWLNEALARSKTDVLAMAQTLRANHYRNNKLTSAENLAKAIRQRDAEALVQAWDEDLQAERERHRNSYFYPYLRGLNCIALPDDLGLALWNARAGAVDTRDENLVLHHWGLRALPGFMRLLRANPGSLFDQAQRYGSVDIAPVAARAAFKLKTLRKAGLKWLQAWPEHALCGLIAPALGKSGEAKDVAAKALRWLAAQGHRELLFTVAARYGDPRVTQAVQAVLDEDPLDLHPSKVGALPELWQPQSWARPLLKAADGDAAGDALGDEAMAAFGQMLTFPRGDGVYEGLTQVLRACTRESLAEFGWEMFSAWLAAGAPAKDNWMFSSLGLLGNDEVARRLTPLIRAWPGEAAHARAVAGLDVLEGIGTDTALMLLNGIAQKVKFKGLQDKAREKIAAIAEARGLSTEELEDRLAPDLGLDERGSLVLDFGPRQFKVGFDEALKPWVRDFTGGVDGARLKDLPKPNKTDDEALAKDATERYKLLKKDAKTIAAQQIQRLETAMCQQRRWTAENFRDFIATHPLVRHIAQRLIWGVYAVAGQDNDGEVEYPNFGGELLSCFRLAEDGSFTTADDEPFALPTDAPQGCALRIGVPHALQIRPEDAQAFGQLFADYELLQPFPQVGRDTYALTEAELATKELKRWEGAVVPTGRILGLTHKAWRRGDAQDGGGIWYYAKPLGNGHLIEFTFEPGITVGMVDEEPEQTLHAVTYGLPGPWGEQRDEDKRNWSELDAISISELIRDMEALREPVQA